MPDFGKLLKKLREEKDLSQEQLATRARTSAMTVSKLERGLHEPSPRTLRRLATALGVGTDEIERELSRDVVYVELPREVFERVKAAADRAKVDVPEWIGRVATVDRPLTIKTPLGRAGGASGASRNRSQHEPQT